MLGFELFGLRVQVCSQLVQFTLVRKGYDNHPRQEMGLGVDDVMPRRDGLRIWKILKKSPQLSSDYGVEKLGSDNDVEKLGSNHSVEKLRLDHEVYRALGC